MTNGKKILLSILFFSISIFLIYAGKTVFADNTVASRVRGKILLQVENNGEAWYIYPADLKRYYLGRPSDAFELMKNMSTGISNSDISKIPVGLIDNGNVDTDADGLPDDLEKALGTGLSTKDSDSDGFDDKTEIINGFDPVSVGPSKIDKTFAEQNVGNIFLQVEASGAAWYVHPSDNKRYFLSRPTDAFNVMRKLGLGISNTDLAKIEENSQVTTENITQVTPTEKEYKNTVYNYTVKYPAEFSLKKFSLTPTMIQITDAKTDFVREHKGVIAVNYIKAPELIGDVEIYRVASKPPSKTLTDKSETINNLEAYENSYEHKSAYEKVTTIKIADKEVVMITLGTTNDKKDYYEKIYDEIVASMKFGK